ncbi:Ldh family oxidoreductase [Pseudoroseomonas wenyumeiae]
MPDYNTVTVPAPALEDMIRGIFLAIGCDDGEAGDIASHLVGSNLAGHDSHGVVRVPRYVDWHKAGYLHAGRKPEVVTDGGAFLLLDAQFGFGHAVTKQGVAMGIARAKQHGAAVVALRNSGHCGRIGTYAEQALAENLISIHFVNVAGSFLVAPYGGVDRRFSTAPIAIGVPLEGRPVVLDFATSLVAEGKVLVASNGGKPLPPDALIEPDGRFSGDPHTLYGEYPQVGARIPGNGPGAIRAFGDHKGSGLALMCELLAGAFTGGGTSGPRDQRGCITNGLLSIYLSPAHFGTEAEFQRMGQEYLEWVAGSRPIDPAIPVMLPGEPRSAAARSACARACPCPPISGRTCAAPPRRWASPFRRCSAASAHGLIWALCGKPHPRSPCGGSPSPCSAFASARGCWPCSGACWRREAGRGGRSRSCWPMAARRPGPPSRPAMR